MKGNSHSRGRWFTTGLVSAWDASNIGVLLLNKYRLSNYGFKYPIFLTLCHMTACSLLSYIAVVWFKTVPATYTFPLSILKNCGFELNILWIRCLWKCVIEVSSGVFYPGCWLYGGVFHCFVCFSDDLEEGELAYLCHAYSCGWGSRHCQWDFDWLLKRIAGTLSSFIFSMSLQFEPSFHLFGFIMCIGATAARALKTVLGGILLSSEACWEKLSSMNLLLYMAPFSILFLFPAALLMEHNVIAITTTLYQNNLVSASEFSPCISCQLDQFLGHQTHQSFNSTGLGKCKVHRGCGHLNIDI